MVHHEVHAGVVSRAGNTQAVVCVNPTRGPTVTRHTLTIELRLGATPLIALPNTGCPIFTRPSSAGVIVLLAVVPHVPVGAGAGVAVHPVHALPPILTGLTGTLVNVLLAREARVAGHTLAQEAVLLVYTGPAVAAWLP